MISLRAKYIRSYFFGINTYFKSYYGSYDTRNRRSALTPFLWGFEERGDYYEFYERVSGARLHAALFSTRCVAYDIPNGLLEDIKYIC